MSWLVFIMGLFIGSFLNVCACRIPCGESVVFPPSRCPACGRRLGMGELVPVLSYLMQGGRCRGCWEKVSWRYPAGELMTAVVFTALFLRFGWPAFLWQAAFFGILIVVFFIDLEHQIIPNRLVLLLLALTVAQYGVQPALPWRDALLGALLGGGLFLALAVVSGGGMGGGDIKLVAVFGLWYGWQQLLLLMFVSFLGGGVVSGVLLATGIKKRKDGIPFGPFLVLAAFVVSMWGQQLIHWYLRLSGL
jgi:leader peptidase (prepilin peptidase) / N-methyltransferase